MTRPLSRSVLAIAALALGVSVGACKKQEAAPAAPSASVDAAAAAPSAPAPAPEAAKSPDAATAAADAYQAIVDATDRTADDRNSDASRKPAEFLRFIGVKPGWKVADLGAGGGYLTELLQRAVQPGGVVYGQNVPLVLQKFGAKPWTERLARAVMKGVVRVDRELGDPLPPEAKDLDLVTIGFFYHDATWLKADREKMNKKIFDALKPGGFYVIADHAAKDGAGATVGESLHRIEKKTVIDEVTKAGFKLDGESDIYANPQDPKDGNVFDPKLRGNTDRFVLRFVKPVAK